MNLIVNKCELSKNFMIIQYFDVRVCWRAFNFFLLKIKIFMPPFYNCLVVYITVIIFHVVDLCIVYERNSWYQQKVYQGLFMHYVLKNHSKFKMLLVEKMFYTT